MKVKLTEEEKETLSYDDVAYLILKEEKQKIRISDLYIKTLELLGALKTNYEEGIGDFFELLITDKRFIILDGGYCDLKINHSPKVIIEEDNDEFEIVSEDNEDDDVLDDDYDETADDIDDDLQDLVIVDENEESEII